MDMSFFLILYNTESPEKQRNGKEKIAGYSVASWLWFNLIGSKDSGEMVWILESRFSSCPLEGSTWYLQLHLQTTTLLSFLENLQCLVHSHCRPPRQKQFPSLSPVKTLPVLLSKALLHTPPPLRSDHPLFKPYCCLFSHLSPISGQIRFHGLWQNKMTHNSDLQIRKPGVRTETLRGALDSNRALKQSSKELMRNEVAIWV